MEVRIRTTSSVLQPHALNQDLPLLSGWRKHAVHVLKHRRYVGILAIGINLLLLAAVITIIFNGSVNQSSSQTANTFSANNTTSTALNPLDQLSSADIAETI